jgi:hypothetical protein
MVSALTIVVVLFELRLNFRAKLKIPNKIENIMKNVNLSIILGPDGNARRAGSGPRAVGCPPLA